jgi:membrane protein implicated in regulation of membrane protease activity
MIFGAYKRTLTVEFVSYVVYATGALVIALLLPGMVALPDWLVFAVMAVVQVLLYRRFYGRF